MYSLKTKQPASGSQDFLGVCLRRIFSLMPVEAEAVRLAIGPIESEHPGVELIRDDVTSQSQPRILLQGWAAEQHVLSDGRRQIFRFILPGDIFGLQTGPHVSVPAVTAISPVSFATMHMFGAAEEAASAFAKIADIVSGDAIKGLRNHVVRLGRLSAYERMAHLMLELYFRLERVGLANGGAFEMPLSQAVLADALGLSTVHANRVLQKLRSEGLLETRHNLCSLPDLKKLAEIADYSHLPQPI